MVENIRILNCPACGAAIDPLEKQGVLKCAYCHSTIEIPPSIPTPAPTLHPRNPIISGILALMRSHERIRAINVIREHTGNTDIREAADIVDAIVRGEEVDL